MKINQLFFVLTMLIISVSEFYSSQLKAGEFSTSANATIASEYVFRGFASSQGDAVLQGTFAFQHDSGFSGGAWGSLYDYGSDDGIEVDLYASYGFSLSDDWKLSAGFTEYTYTGDSNASTEFNVGLSYQNFSITYYDDVDLDTVYINLAGTFKVTDKGQISINVANRNPDIGQSNNDFSIGYNHSFTAKFSGLISYISNSLDVPGAEDYLVGSVTYSF